MAVGRLEIGADRFAAGLVVDADEPGRLAIADRGSERGQAEELAEQNLGHGRGAEAAHVAPPGDELGEFGLEVRVEPPRLEGGVRQILHRASFSCPPGIARLGRFGKGNIRPKRQSHTNFVDQGNDTMSLPVGSTLMPGWTVSGSHYLAWIGPTNPFGVTASSGSYFLDLTGYVDGAPFSGVSQTIATHSGATYLLTFDLGSDPTYGLQDGVSVSAGSVSDLVVISTNDGTQHNLWQSESLSFTATGSSTTISLIGESGSAYIGLDNVGVVQTSGGVPEASTWALLLIGFGGLGCAGLRRTRQTAAPTIGA